MAENRFIKAILSYICSKNHVLWNLAVKLVKEILIYIWERFSKNNVPGPNLEY